MAVPITPTAQAITRADASPSPDIPQLIPLAPAAAAQFVPCARHPESPAVTRCFTCKAALCTTCDFAFPGGIHLCPSCATNPRPQVSPKRRILIWWSIILGACSLLTMAGFFVAIVAMRGSSDAASMASVFVVISLFAALIGVALGTASFDRRLKTPGYVWFGVISNGVVLLIWLLLIIVGLARQRG